MAGEKSMIDMIHTTYTDEIYFRSNLLLFISFACSEFLLIGGGMARARTSVTSLIVGRAFGFGLEHASPNISKRLTSSLLMLTLPIAN